MRLLNEVGAGIEPIRPSRLRDRSAGASGQCHLRAGLREPDIVGPQQMWIMLQ